MWEFALSPIESEIRKRVKGEGTQEASETRMVSNEDRFVDGIWSVARIASRTYQLGHYTMNVPCSVYSQHRDKRSLKVDQDFKTVQKLYRDIENSLYIFPELLPELFFPE